MLIGPTLDKRPPLASQSPQDRPFDSRSLAQGKPLPTQFDRYGNRVDNAVTEYGVDDRGDLYERHSPNTALLKLRPPRT